MALYYGSGNSGHHHPLQAAVPAKEQVSWRTQETDRFEENYTQGCLETLFSDRSIFLSFLAPIKKQTALAEDRYSGFF